MIPLSEVNETSSTGVEKSTGVLGPLSSVLRSDRQYRGLVNFVAGDTVLVETEAIAYVLASEGYKTVTTTGEVFELGGRAFAYGLHDMLSNILQGLEDIEDVGEVEAAVAALRAAIDRRKTMLEGLDVEARSVGKDRVKEDRLRRGASGRGGDGLEAFKAIQDHVPSPKTGQGQPADENLGRTGKHRTAETLLDDPVILAIPVGKNADHHQRG